MGSADVDEFEICIGQLVDTMDAKQNQHVVDAIITSFNEERWVKL